MRAPLLIVLAATGATVCELTASAGSPCGPSASGSSAPGGSPEPDMIAAERLLDRVAGDCTRFRAAHPAWVRA